MDRRTFLQRSSLVALTSPFWGCAPDGPGNENPASASSSESTESARLARIGITTVCLRSHFPATRTMLAEPYSGPDLSLETAPAFIAEELGLHNVEVWDYQFEETSVAYCERVRAAAERVGSRISNIQIDMLEDLSDPDPAVRSLGIMHAKAWVDRAVALGAPGMRVNTGGQEGQTFDLEVTSESFRQIADYGQENNVLILVENISGFSLDINKLVAIIEHLNHPGVRALADYGTPGGTTEHRIEELKKMFPYLGFVSAKGTGFNERFEHSDYDFGEIVRATEESGYRGIYSIEMWPDADSEPPSDPIRAANWMKETILANIT